MAKILIIEDDTEIHSMLVCLLTYHGYQVVSAYSGTEGILIHQQEIDLILLDLMLPGKKGEEVISELKVKHTTPIIVMSAIHDVDKKIDLFGLGADDYITKPFHNDELIARIEVQLRREKNEEQSTTYSFKDITIFPATYQVTCNKKSVNLSKTEFELLKVLIVNQHQVCTKSMLFENVWNHEDSADDNTLNVHISKIRTKLKEKNPTQDYIETIWSIGYQMKK